MPIATLTGVKRANDVYRATLRSTWVASPADTSLLVDAIPTNVPTYVTVGWGTDYETVFSVTGTSGTSSADYALTGVTRVKGANANIPENTAVNCLNHEEFFNQYETAINDVIDGVNTAIAEAVIGIETVASDVDTEVGDGKAFFRVPVRFNGWTISGVAATVYTAGTTGTTDIQVRNKTDAVDVLSTKLTVDSGETDSSTAAVPAVINTANDDLATGDVIAIDVDVISTTPAKGLYVELTLSAPAA